MNKLAFNKKSVTDNGYVVIKIQKKNVSFSHVLISKPKYLVLYMNVNVNEEKFVMSLNLK